MALAPACKPTSRTAVPATIDAVPLSSSGQGCHPKWPRAAAESAFASTTIAVGTARCSKQIPRTAALATSSARRKHPIASVGRAGDAPPRSATATETASTSAPRTRTAAHAIRPAGPTPYVSRVRAKRGTPTPARHPAATPLSVGSVARQGASTSWKTARTVAAVAGSATSGFASRVFAGLQSSDGSRSSLLGRRLIPRVSRPPTRSRPADGPHRGPRGPRSPARLARAAGTWLVTSGSTEHYFENEHNHS